MKNVFGTYHPAVDLLFFCAVIGFGVFLIHPVMLAISLLSSFLCMVMVKGRSAVKMMVFVFLPAVIAVTAINMYVNPRGDTVLWYTEYSRVTLEAMVFGMLTGLLICAVISWSVYFSAVMTGDKITFLFGRIMPAMSLVFTMVLRFIPNFNTRIKEIYRAQKAMGRDRNAAGAVKKIRHGAKIVSIMFTWSLEHSVDTADSMRARGYELKGRSAFNYYRFDRRDTVMTAILAILCGAVIAGILTGRTQAVFYPCIELARTDMWAAAVYAAYLILCMMPVILQIKEVFIWKYMRSGI